MENWGKPGYRPSSSTVLSNENELLRNLFSLKRYRDRHNQTRSILRILILAKILIRKISSNRFHVLVLNKGLFGRPRSFLLLKRY